MGKNWKSTADRHDYYQEVTDHIVAMLEKGVLPWRQQWESGRCEVPRNGATGHIYRGINRLLLDMMGVRFGRDPRWCSYRQALARGWQVKRGESGTRIFFYRRIELSNRDEGNGAENESGSSKRFFALLRAYTVFHFSQIEGVPAYVSPQHGEQTWQKPESVQTILDASGIEVRTVGDRACYMPATDVMCLPPAHAFDSADLWAEVALHEFSHATGHPSRLDRKLSARFGSEDYAFEELIVSLATSMVGPELGIAVNVANQANYIDDWLRALRKEKRLIFKAAAEAQRIADYVLELHPDYAAAHAAASPADQEEAEDNPASLDEAA